MTRGKYANASEARRAREDAQADATRLAKENAGLRAEIERLDQANLKQQAEHIRISRDLRTMIVAGTSEKIEDLEARLADAVKMKDLALVRVQQERVTRSNTMNWIFRYLAQTEGVTYEQAQTIVLNAISTADNPDGEGDLEILPEGLDARRVAKLSKAGQRSLVTAQRAITGKVLST